MEAHDGGNPWRRKAWGGYLKKKTAKGSSWKKSQRGHRFVPKIKKRQSLLTGKKTDTIGKDKEETAPESKGEIQPSVGVKSREEKKEP